MYKKGYNSPEMDGDKLNFVLHFITSSLYFLFIVSFEMYWSTESKQQNSVAIQILMDRTVPELAV